MAARPSAHAAPLRLSILDSRGSPHGRLVSSCCRLVVACEVVLDIFSTKYVLGIVW